MMALPATMAVASELKLTFPQGRSAFQTNELIGVSVVRTADGDLPAGNVTLVLEGEKTKATIVFGLKAASAVDGNASATDHLHLNGWLIKPGNYTLTATMGDVADKADIEMYSHIRKSTYRTIHWGGPHGEAMKGEGENGLGFNLNMGGVDEWSIREGMDIMGITAMGGMHQHDGNMECDWSDPYVYIGAIQRGMDRGMPFRTMPNFIGLQVHDEPGLTHAKHPRMKKEDGEPVWGPHDVAPQRAGYLRAFGQEPIWLDEVDSANPELLAKWTQANDFKLGYMDAFWRATRDAVERIKPGALTVTQSVYGWAATFDGYYFNVARSLPVISGHGGYNDFWLKNFNPSLFLEMAMPRQWDKPTWYLPTFYDLSSETFKFEMYMSFITGIQGVASNPGLNAKSKGAPGVQEANHVFARLGTIFAKPEYTRHDVAMLFSKSNIFYNKDIQTDELRWTFLAAKMAQYPMMVVLDEDILDGTVAASHKAVIVVGVNYLDPAVIDALADFAANGGLVLVGDEVTVNIPGATKLGYKPADVGATIDAAWARDVKPMPEGDEKAAASTEVTGMIAILKAVRPLADVLGAKLAAANIAPAFATDNPLMVAGRQVRGEIEYTFALNATMVSHMKSGAGEPGPATATITLPDNGRPVYDAMTGKEMTKTFAKSKDGISAKFEFGGGDMKAFARPARPIGGVLVSAPTVHFDLTREGQPPIQMTLAATLVDTKNTVISGTAPLQIVVKDPAGKVRYDLFRATDAGVCTLTLPLAANDAAGKWTVTVTDLLAGTKGDASFEFKPLTRARTIAGATHRAVFFGDDKANIYRFFRDQRNVTIVKGSSDYNDAAAKRLVEIFKPYNVICDIVNAADVPARELSAEEAQTWCGTVVAGALRGVKPGRENPAQNVGWDLKNPVIVIGTPEDNVMLGFMANERNVLPYKLTSTFPGRGNGLVAWNVQTLGHDVQAIVCIGYDAEGMNQAVGTLFELAVGLDALFPLALPSSAVIEAVK